MRHARIERAHLQFPAKHLKDMKSRLVGVSVLPVATRRGVKLRWTLRLQTGNCFAIERQGETVSAQEASSVSKVNADLSQRKREILEIAAQLFAEKGYRGTSIRDIGAKAGVLGGSLYHHIKSKDALFIELHNAALDAAADRIGRAIAGDQNPWSRLERACITLVETQVDVNSLTFPLMNDFREVPESVRKQLIMRRDRFEDVFRQLVDALPLPSTVDRSIYRNLLLSQLNAVAHWFRPGRLSAADVGRQIALIFRHD